MPSFSWSFRKMSIEPGFDDGPYVALRGLGHDVSIADARTVVHGDGQAVGF